MDEKLQNAKHVDMDASEIGRYLLPDKVYLVLKWVGLLLLPTLAWVYAVIGDVWNLPFTQQIPITLNVLGTFVAVAIGASQIHATGSLE